MADKSIVMLLCKYSCRNKVCNLFIILHGFKAARIATSVLPCPTSPHIRRSITRGLCISFFTSSMAVSWSSVSVWAGKFQTLSAKDCPPNIQIPPPAIRRCINCNQIFGKYLTAAPLLPSLCSSRVLRAYSGALFHCRCLYFCTASIWLTGINRLPPSA